MEFLKRFVVYFVLAVAIFVFLGLLAVGIWLIYDLVYWLFSPVLGRIVVLIGVLLAVIAFVFSVIHHFEVELEIDIRDKRKREKFLFEWWHGKRKRLVSKKTYVNFVGERWVEVNPTKSAVRKFTQLNPGEKLVCEGCLDEENCQLIGKVFIAGVGYDPKDYRKKLWVEKDENPGKVFTCDKPCFARRMFPEVPEKIPMPHLRIFEQGGQDASSNA